MTSLSEKLHRTNGHNFKKTNDSVQTTNSEFKNTANFYELLHVRDRFIHYSLFISVMIQQRNNNELLI